VNVTGQFAHASERVRKHPALISGIGSARRALSYGELNERVDRATELLRRAALRPGDRVLLAVPISTETYIAMLAVLKAGLVIMFVDPAHGAQTLARCLRAHPPKAIIASPTIMMLRLLSPELRRIPLRFTVAGTGGAATNICDGIRPLAPQPNEQRSLEDSALLTFTSGSGGEPKAVVRTHGFLHNQFTVLTPVAKLEPDDIDLVSMPMFVLFNLAAGITSIIPACDVTHPGKATPHVLAGQLIQERATRMIASPALLERLARSCAKTCTPLPHLRCFCTGGGPVSPTLPRRLKTIAPGARIRLVYGSTEAEPIACIDNDAISLSDLSQMREGAGLLVGRPVAGCEVRIIENRQCERMGPWTSRTLVARSLAARQTGEIIVSGKHVLRGYADSWQNRGTKIEVNGTLWHRTGDAGYFDTLGRLWLSGRCDAAIRDARGELYPFQVEYALSAVRGIRRAALIADSGKRLLVIEVRARRFEADCLRMARCIASQDIDRIIAVRRIPTDRRHGAKVDYPALRRQLQTYDARFRAALICGAARVYRFVQKWLKNARAMAARALM